MLVEGMDGVAHGLVVAPQRTGNRRSMVAIGTGEQNVAAAHGKGGGRTEACLQRGPLVGRKWPDKKWCLHTEQCTTCPTTFSETALGCGTEIDTPGATR